MQIEQDSGMLEHRTYGPGKYGGPNSPVEIPVRINKYNLLEFQLSGE